MRNDKIPTESRQSLPLHRVLEDEYITLYGPLPNGYPWSFLPSDIRDPASLIFKLFTSEDGLSQLLRKRFCDRLAAQRAKQHADISVAELSDLLCGASTQPEAHSAAEQLPEHKLGVAAIRAKIEHTLEVWRTELADFLNIQLTDEDLYTEERFQNIRLREKTEELARSHQQGKRLSQVNRRLLEEAYRQELRAKPMLYDLSGRDGLVPEADDEDSEPLNGAERREQVYRDMHTQTLYRLIHEKQKYRSALCLSGGGIRSATFNLGILQGLARHGLLQEFDYLSTVSGGGYIGSWLSAWVRRHPEGLGQLEEPDKATKTDKAKKRDGVMGELARQPTSPLEPEPREVTHLRAYSNYLSPHTGLLSADTWTLFVIYVRNLLLNWMVFIPLLLAVLMIPRMGVAAVLHGRAELDWLEPLTLVGGIIAALVALFYAGYNLPRDDNRRSHQSSFFLYCLMPLITACILLTYFWSLYQEGSHWWGWDYLSQRFPGWFQRLTGPYRFMLGGSLMLLLGWGLYISTRWRAFKKYVEESKAEGQSVRWKILIELSVALLILVMTGSLTGYALWWIATTSILINPAGSFDHARLFACLAAPLLLAVTSLGTNLIVGFGSRRITDADLEWLARFAAWVLIIIVVWATMNALVLYGPNLLLASFRGDWRWWSQLTTAIGVISGAITLIGGFSAKTPASTNGQNQSMLQKTFRYQLPRLAAPAFLFFIIIVLSTVTNWILSHFSHWVNHRFPDLPINYYSKLPEMAGSLYPDWMNHDWMVQNSRFDFLLLMTIVMAGIGYVMGRFFIDTGKFSIHAMYGNRLERAYLGASRKDRRGNWFTNFDPGDDVPMHELRPALFHEASFKNIESLIEKLKNGHTHLDKEIYEKLSPLTRQMIEESVSESSAPPELREALAEDLNKMLDAECLYVGEHLQEGDGRVAQLLRQSHQGESLVLLNRWLLEEAFPDEIEQSCTSKPLHVVNMALNLMRGDNLAWQERKAETFTVSPLHSGNHMLGYRRTRYYGSDTGISLGTAFTISGAAASPNMGYMIASPLVSFLMAMFNVRLGWWLGNPGKAGDETFNLSVPKFAIGPLFSEALSMTDDKSPYVYLSDGGHFDNLGLYEMVLRRCRLIIVSDATTDPNYKFDALGMAIRKIRIDLGVPIEFNDGAFNLHTRPSSKANKDGRYCAIGTIRYSCVDNIKPDDDGVLIYIKAGLAGNEPQDVLHYQQENEQFPQEFIADQFFSESQFESYRMLGSHIIETLCGAKADCRDLVEFEKRARAYHKPPAGPPKIFVY